jgi:enamine deaminase RidA (YjgF/YER057c/UK114 family)
VQTGQVLDNLGAVLTEAGMDYADVVSVSVFIAENETFPLRIKVKGGCKYLRSRWSLNRLF